MDWSRMLAAKQPLGGPETSGPSISHLIIGSLTSMRTTTRLPWCLLLIYAWPVDLQAASAVRRPANVVDAGTLLVVANGRLTGAEDYEIARHGSLVRLHSAIQYVDPMTRHEMSMSADVRVRDGAFERLDVNGHTPSKVHVRTTVEVEKGEVLITGETGPQREKPPREFFAITASLPASTHALLFEYWIAHGQPKAMQVFPRRNISIQFLGEDVVKVDGRPVILRRYALTGVTWSRETMWMDSRQRLVALVTHYQSNDVPMPIEVVRDGYMAALPFFLRKAVDGDEAAYMNRLAESLAQHRTQTVVLVGGTLVDGTGSAPVADAVIVIKGDRIAAAGRRSELAIPADAEAIDVTGQTVLPGLWDMHLHSFSTEWVLGEFAGGITTARDCGSQIDFITAVRDAIRSGRGVGPRLLLVGTMDTTGDSESNEGGMELRVQSPEDARAAVRRFHELGFEQSKVFEDMPAELVRVITEESHRLQMTVTGHVPTELGPIKAVEAGMDGIEHVFPLIPAFVSPDAPPPPDVPGLDKSNLLGLQVDPSSDRFKEAVRFFRDHHTVLDPTLLIGERWYHSTATPMATYVPGIGKMPPELAEALKADGLAPASAAIWEQEFAKELLIVGALHKAGVAIMVGSDARIPAHEFHRELELLVKAGLTPMEVIQAATIVPARVMKLDKELGTIEAGKLADLIIVDGNPIKNISDVQKVKTVIKGGRMYEAAALWGSIGWKP
jgi:hypothetical protein